MMNLSEAGQEGRSRMVFEDEAGMSSFFDACRVKNRFTYSNVRVESPPPPRSEIHRRR